MLRQFVKTNVTQTLQYSNPKRKKLWSYNQMQHINNVIRQIHQVYSAIDWDKLETGTLKTMNNIVTNEITAILQQHDLHHSFEAEELLHILQGDIPEDCFVSLCQQMHSEKQLSEYEVIAVKKSYYSYIVRAANIHEAVQIAQETVYEKLTCCYGADEFETEIEVEDVVVSD